MDDIETLERALSDLKQSYYGGDATLHIPACEVIEHFITKYKSQLHVEDTPENPVIVLPIRLIEMCQTKNDLASLVDEFLECKAIEDKDNDN